MALTRLVYLSSATQQLSKTELLEILHQSRPNNLAREITGLLLYKDGNILQILEGEGAAVNELFAHIERDARHQGVIVLLNEPVDERAFPEWSMGFRDLADPELAHLAGYNALLNHPTNQAQLLDQQPAIRELVGLFSGR